MLLKFSYDPENKNKKRIIQRHWWIGFQWFRRWRILQLLAVSHIHVQISTLHGAFTFFIFAHSPWMMFLRFENKIYENLLSIYCFRCFHRPNNSKIKFINVDNNIAEQVNFKMASLKMILAVNELSCETRIRRMAYQCTLREGFSHNNKKKCVHFSTFFSVFFSHRK